MTIEIEARFSFGDLGYIILDTFQSHNILPSMYIIRNMY